MQTPPTVARLLEPVTLREDWATARIIVNLAVVVLVLVVPGISAIVLKPDNAGEGYVAIALAVAAVLWQVRRLQRAGIEVGPAGVRRLGADVVPWTDIVDLHWHTGTAVDRQAQRNRLHWLRLTTAGGTTTLTRYPAKDHQAAGMTAALQELGVTVSSPDWSAAVRG